MSSKKIWAASLAAVIAGSTFAVVATAADTVDPGASGEVTSNGIKVNVQAGTDYVDKVETDGTTLKITPKRKAYTVKDANKTTLTVTLSGIKETKYTMVKGDLSGEIKDGTATLEIKDYDLKETAKKQDSKTYNVSLMGNGVDDLKVSFTIKNVGTFVEPTYKVTPKSDAITKIDTSKPSDADVIVVYDPAEITGASAYDELDFTVSGNGSLNGDPYLLNEKLNAGDDFRDMTEGGYGKYTLTWKDNKTNGEPDYTKEVTFHFVTEADYADLPEESKPADESKDESKDDTSSDTVVEKEVTVDVAVGDVTDAGLVLDPAKIFTGDAATASWADVQEIKFTSDKPFALVFSVEKGAVKDKADAETFTKGVDAYKALDKAALATEQTLTAEDAAHVAKSTAKTVTLQTAEGETATVKATVKVKVKTTDTAPNTGIALAIAPAALATAFVTVAAVMSKKKKG